MNVIKWSPFPGADIAYYKIYRSIIGFTVPNISPALLSGLTLPLRMDSGPIQTILFDSTTPIADKINSILVGGAAYPSTKDPNYILVRSNTRTAPGNIIITGGTSLALLNQTARTITEKSEYDLISTIQQSIPPLASYECEDPDGVCQDWYAISTVNAQGAESLKTPFRQPMSYTGELCSLEGIVTNLQGARMPDVEIIATIVEYPVAIGKCPQITRDPITTLTGSDGRFSLPLLQGVLVKFEIPAAEFIRNIEVPCEPCAFLTDIQVDLDYRYPLEVNI